MKAKIIIKVPRVKVWKKLPSHLVVTKVERTRKVYMRKKQSQEELQKPED